MLDSLSDTTSSPVTNSVSYGQSTNTGVTTQAGDSNTSIYREYLPDIADNTTSRGSPTDTLQHTSGGQQTGQQKSLSPTEACLPRRKIRCKDEKICKVCGDKALGYNFNAMTCESCKAFFRRNARKSNTSTCLFQNDCFIDLRTRRFCPSCRLAKCLGIGMKKEMILDDTERKARMQKVSTNRRKRSQHEPPETPTPVVKEEVLSDSDILPDQSGCPSDTASLSDCIKQLESKVLRTQYEVDFGAGTGLERHDDSPDKYRRLTALEHELFAEIRLSYQQTIGSFLVGDPLTGDDYKDVNDLVNHSEMAVRHLITFIKRMEDFQQLCQDDQITSLKACVLNSLLLRSAFFYSVKDDAWITPNGLIPTSILKKTTGYGDIHDVHTNFCKQIKDIIGNDCTLFALLQIIVIFMPDGFGLKDRVHIANTQDKYYILLKHYLEALFSFEEAKFRFANLIEKMCELSKLSDGHAQVLLQVNARDIEPLMLEVLNLK